MDKPPVVLIDQDGVVADYEEGFLKLWRQRYPEKPSLELYQRTALRIEDDYEQLEKGLGDLVRRVLHEPGFNRHLPVIPGAIRPVVEMLGMGIEVFFCSSPSYNNPTCHQEKVDWFRDHYGLAIAKRLILTTDKTLVRGDILIDDTPSQSGLMTPTWQMVTFTASYNISADGLRLCHWSDWRKVVLPLLGI